MFNIVSFGKKTENLKITLQTNIIGSSLTTAKESIKNGSTIMLHCNSRVWGIAKVVSNYFYSEDPLWTDKSYPHRFKIEPIYLISKPVELSDGTINVELRKRFGAGWAYRFIFSPKPLPQDISKQIISKVRLEKEISVEKLITLIDNI